LFWLCAAIDVIAKNTVWYLSLYNQLMNTFRETQVSIMQLGIILLCLVFGKTTVQASAPSRVQQFAVMGYEGIVRDAAQGKGPYLQTLLELMAVPLDQRAGRIQQIADLARSETNILQFSEKVVALPVSVPIPLSEPLPVRAHLYQGDVLPNALAHLTRGMRVTVYSHSGETVRGTVVDYSNRRLRLRGGNRSSFQLDEIRAIEAEAL